MDIKPKRKRINETANQLQSSPVIEDPQAFIKNNCSDNARRILTDIEEIKIELWFDKHYHDRVNVGDDNGKREGIDEDIVKKLVGKSIKHLLFYASVLNGFSFINHKEKPITPIRIVLQESHDNEMLNVVIEVHFIGISHYEITVKTAMCVSGFRISDGQYVIEIQGDTSYLKQKVKNEIKEIFNS